MERNMFGLAMPDFCCEFFYSYNSDNLAECMLQGNAFIDYRAKG
jgi:hypothetical protein